MDKFKNVLSKFVERQKQNPHVIGIIISGSYIHSVMDKNSDLDVYVLLDESETRERGNTWIDDIEIEYFINPIKQVRHYFKTEIGNKAPCTAHMFVNSIILYKKGEELENLIKEAKEILNQEQSKMDKMDSEMSKYFIDDLRKDLEDVFLKKDEFAFNLIANEIINKSLQIFFKIKGGQKEKDKRLKNQLSKIDDNFQKLFFNAVTETNWEKKYFNLNQLIEYIENLLGGKRPKEWKLISKCTYK